MRSGDRHLPSLAHRSGWPGRLPKLSDSRLRAELEAAAIRRSAEAHGGFATVLRRGDSDRGSLLLSVASRGVHVTVLERALQADGGYRWQACGPAAGSDPAMIADFASKRVRFDPDLWLIELDIPDPTRFIVEITAEG